MHLYPEAHRALVQSTTKTVRDDGIDKILPEHGMNVILGPADSDLEVIFGVAGR